MTPNEVKRSKWQTREGKSLELQPFTVLGVLGNGWVVLRRGVATPIVEHIRDFGRVKKYFKVE